MQCVPLKIKRAKIVCFSKALSIACTVSRVKIKLEKPSRDMEMSEIIEEIDDNDNGPME